MNSSNILLMLHTLPIFPRMACYWAKIFAKIQSIDRGTGLPQSISITHFAYLGIEENLDEVAENMCVLFPPSVLAPPSPAIVVRPIPDALFYDPETDPFMGMERIGAEAPSSNIRVQNNGMAN